MDQVLLIHILLLFISSGTPLLLPPGSENCDCAELKALVVALNQTVEQKLYLHAPTGFTAILTKSTVTLGDLQPIEFDQVLTNVGNAYDARHGHFVAPVKGLYQFSATILDTGNNDHAYLQMVKNGVEIARIHTEVNVNTDPGSTSVIVVLEVNDMVWIRHFPGQPTQQILGDHWSSFSGFLLRTM